MRDVDLPSGVSEGLPVIFGHNQSPQLQIFQAVPSKLGLQLHKAQHLPLALCHSEPLRLQTEGVHAASAGTQSAMICIL